MHRFSTPWIGEKRGYLSDWITQLWVKSSRYKVSLDEEKWLDGPTGEPKRIGESYFEDFARNNGLIVDSGANGSGLVEDFSHLDNQQFTSKKLHPRIVEFYQHTSNFELDIWSEWTTVAKPFGWLLSVLFSKRIQQLNLPVSALESSRGITSKIILLKKNKKTHYVGWLRKGIQTGNVIYAGAYTSCTPPNLGHECVKVVFPLPNGNATVILWPENIEDGSLKLHSSGKKFGDGGFYLLVHSSNKKAHVKYVRSIKETIHVYVDENDELRTDHIFTFWGTTFLQLHYRIRKKGDKFV